MEVTQNINYSSIIKPTLQCRYTRFAITHGTGQQSACWACQGGLFVFLPHTQPKMVGLTKRKGLATIHDMIHNPRKADFGEWSAMYTLGNYVVRLNRNVCFLRYDCEKVTAGGNGLDEAKARYGQANCEEKSLHWHGLDVVLRSVDAGTKILQHEGKARLTQTGGLGDAYCAMFF
jgi:hypothetical protein